MSSQTEASVRRQGGYSGGDNDDKPFDVKTHALVKLHKEV